ncbi:MAG: hypothetical protein JWO71_2541 [Candidatus Acidoferrum typicum]|nr:hypothetical protein [Candidatus Acidoferrum typicum]
MRKVRVFPVLLLLTSLPVSHLAAAVPDSPDSSAAAAPAAAPGGPAKESSEGRIPIGIGVKVSTLGIGGEVAIAVSHRSNVRVGFNAFSYGDTFDKDGVTYKGNLNLRSAQATYDIFLLKGLHISPGVLFYNGNQVSANASVPGGKSFTLSNTNYVSDPADPITGTGKLTVYKAAPMLLFGIGNLVPRSRHFSTSFEIGAAYQGPPRVTLNLSGSACDSSGLFCRSISSDPTIQSNIAAEQAKLNKSASPYKFYPVLSFGIGYKF